MRITIKPTKHKLTSINAASAIADGLFADSFMDCMGAASVFIPVSVGIILASLLLPVTLFDISCVRLAIAASIKLLILLSSPE